MALTGNRQVKRDKQICRSRARRALPAPGSQRRRGRISSAARAWKSGNDLQRLVQELEVHQRELEAQNEELREAQQQLESSRDRYADLYDFAPIGYVTLDPSGRIREINQTGATILGRTRSRLMGMLFSLAVAKSDLNKLRAHLRQCGQGCGQVTTELTLAVPGVEPIQVQLHSVRARDPAYPGVMCRTAITDITKRQRAEETLRESQKQLRDQHSELEHLYRTAPVGLALLDSSLRFVRLNERLAEINGRTVAQHLGRSLREVLPKLAPQLEPVFRHVIASAQPVIAWQVHGIVPAQPGVERHWLVNYCPIQSDSGDVRFISAVVQDITEIKRTEETLRQARDQLEGRVRERTADLDRAIAELRKEITVRKQAEEELRQLPRKILDTQETERKRVARDLHDGVGQTLSLAYSRLQAVDYNLSRGDPAAWRRAVDVRELVGRTLEEVRRISHGLMPSELENLGLAAAFRCLCGEFEDRAGFSVDLRCSAIPRELAIEIKLALFRISQEALNNIEKHAKATKVGVRLRGKKAAVKLTIQDNGTGFARMPPRALSPEDMRMGLANMKERAAAVGGTVEILSAPAKGSTIQVWIPCKNGSGKNASDNP